VGHTILVAAYYILQDEVAYHDLGSEHFDRLRRERTVAHLVGRLQRLGYNVALAAIKPQAA
jgi:transposase